MFADVVSASLQNRSEGSVHKLLQARKFLGLFLTSLRRLLRQRFGIGAVIVGEREIDLPFLFACEAQHDSFDNCSDVVESLFFCSP